MVQWKKPFTASRENTRPAFHASHLAQPKTPSASAGKAAGKAVGGALLSAGLNTLLPGAGLLTGGGLPSLNLSGGDASAKTDARQDFSNLNLGAFFTPVRGNTPLPYGLFAAVGLGIVALLMFRGKK